jgi:hypothetical protein
VGGLQLGVDPTDQIAVGKVADEQEQVKVFAEDFG